MTGNNPLLEKNVKFIIVHCSDTKETDTATDIHKLHLSFGWAGIGYHKIILQNGKIENGRPEFWQGAHAYKYNDKSVGVCLIGKSNFNNKQFKSLKKLLILWKKKYKNAKIIGHKDLPNTKKTCPNFDVQLWCRKENIL